MKKNTFLMCLAALTIFAVGCKKTEPLAIAEPIERGKTISSIIYNFDWENAERMPVPAGAETILSPWASGANHAFPAAFITDRSKTDGWELVYNTFNTTEVINPRFFTIYNKYRGLLRTFYYLAPTSPIPSKNVSHTIKLKDNVNSSILNYSSEEIVSLSTKQVQGTLVQPYRTAATGTWYAAEFEMNYDPNTINLQASSNLLQWDVNSVNISDISISGQSQGEVKGTMAQSTAPSSSNFFSTALKGAIQYTSQSIGAPFTDDIKKSPDNNKPFLQGLISSISSGVPTNIVKTVLNGIFNISGSSTPTVSNISLKTSTNYTFSGSITDSYLIASPTLIMPGTKNASTALGITPMYNKPLGLFTLSSTPIVDAKWATISGTQRGNGYNIYDEPFSIDNPYSFILKQSSYSIVFNPAVINTSTTGAHIENIQQELVRRNTITDALTPFPLNTDFAFAYTIPDSEFQNIHWQPGMGGLPPLPYARSSYGNDNLFTEFFLKISFDVVPNNNSRKIKIVKSFKLKNNYIQI